MTEKIKNVAIAVAVLIASVAYAYSTITTSRRTNDYYQGLDKAKAECLKEGDNTESDYGYAVCMRYRGYDLPLGS